MPAILPEERLCPLCRTAGGEVFFRDARRDYFRCSRCLLVFVPPTQFLTEAEEKAEYDLHRNSPEDLGYRRFLGRIFTPMKERLSPQSFGLDFGSGPGPTLSVMFGEAGHNMAIYDPFYAPGPSVFSVAYDFITATEVVEHLHHPGRELDRLWSILRPGGWLGVMTKLVIDREKFAGWHYRNDPTHICFFSAQTFKWLADCWHADLSFFGKDVILLHKIR